MDDSMEKENFCLEDGNSPFLIKSLNQKLLDIPQMMDMDESPTTKSPWLSSVASTNNGLFQESPFMQFKVKKRRNKELLNVSNECAMEEDVNNVTPTRRAFAPVNYGRNPDKASNFKPDNDFSPCGSSSLVKIAIQNSNQNPDLIGDFSKTCVLPVINGKHPDLMSISSETVIEVLTGRFQGQFIIIDCRYPYEYHGGHIRGARNLYTKDAIMSTLLPVKECVKFQQSKNILIFYCEFSSERAPKMYRFFRGKDRDLNTDTYPLLHYPEMYVLNGGYKSFFMKYKEYCEPPAYKTMLDDNHTQDMVHFRSECRCESSNKLPMRARTKARAGLKF